MASIGIAFGNSTSSIAIAKDDGKIDVIANPDGDRFIASALSYVGDDEYHGAQAQAQLVRNPNSTIVNFRDYIGLPFDKIDPTYSQNSAHPINLDGKTGYSINDKQVTVDEIATRHLKQIKAAAEDYIGEKIEGAVIAVPTNFSEGQKAALKKISSDADIKVLQLINEPTAALFAHLVAKDALDKDRLFVVADFGGVRSDAAVIAVRGGILTILATAHDYELGGDKLDDCLVEYFAKEFQKKYKVDPTANARSLAKLKSACIITKKTLSNVQTSTISIDSLAEGYDFHSTINRLRFEVAGRSVFTRMSAFVESVVAKAGLETLDIDEVLLVGGSSNIPKVAANVAAVFPESTVISSPSTDSKLCNPNELICRGAALQASIVASFDVEEIEESTQPVVTNTQHIAKPIGIKTGEGEFLTVVSRETAYPIRKSVTLKAGADDVFIELYEGERKVKETVVEAEKFSDDEDSEEEEPEIVKSVHYVPGTLLAQMALRGVGEGSSVEVIVNINKDGKLQLVGRSGDKVVKGDV